MHREALDLLQRSMARAGPLHGPTPTIEYLQRLGPEFLDLILDFSRHILNMSPEEGLSIFMDDNAPHAQQLPRVAIALSSRLLPRIALWTTSLPWLPISLRNIW